MAITLVVSNLAASAFEEKEGDRSSGMTRSLPRGVNLPDVTETGSKHWRSRSEILYKADALKVFIECTIITGCGWVRNEASGQEGLQAITTKHSGGAAHLTYRRHR